MKTFEQILQSETLNKQDLVRMLSCNNHEHSLLIKAAESIRLQYIGNKVYGRALIELSNICSKDCYYCGIRKSNKDIERYSLNLDSIKESIDVAIDSKIGSIAIQSGEISSKSFINSISDILQYIKARNPEIGITLSCGEHSDSTYRLWKNLGAERYLLRIETSNKNLYYQYHPENKTHNFEERISCLQSIKNTGYQTGTGVMIGLPNQNIEDLADDLLFMKEFGIHMCGMGPFIPCNGTPLENSKSNFNNVFEMSLRMIACLRLLMPKINIVASTAMETINPQGRELAILAGANIIMPNLNPSKHRKKYLLYNKKPSAEISTKQEALISCEAALPHGYELVLGSKGNSLAWE